MIYGNLSLSYNKGKLSGRRTATGVLYWSILSLDNIPSLISSENDKLKMILEEERRNSERMYSFREEEEVVSGESGVG